MFTFHNVVWVEHLNKLLEAFILHYGGRASILTKVAMASVNFMARREFAGKVNESLSFFCFGPEGLLEASVSAECYLVKWFLRLVVFLQ